MISETEKNLRKLSRAPSGINFSRFIQNDPLKARTAILRFVTGKITFSYAPAHRAIVDYARWHVATATLRKSIERSGAPMGREKNLSLFDAFTEFDAKLSYQQRRYIDTESNFYPISADIRVPVTPHLLAYGEKCFTYTSICGWLNEPLSETQIRFLWTMLEDAVFSLEDLRNAEAEILLFPRQVIASAGGSIAVRQPKIMRRGQYQLLSKAEMDELTSIFCQGRELARQELLKAADREPARYGDDDFASQEPDLFTGKG